METELYKSRSLSSCMKAAYDLFSTNIRTIIRRTWLPALIFSVLAAISMVLLSDNVYQESSTTALTAKTIVTNIIAVVLCIVAIAADVWFDAIIISLLNGFSMKKNLPRVIRLTLLMIVLAIIVTIVSSAASILPFVGAGKKGISDEAIYISSAISIGIYALYIIAIIPILYSSMKYLVEPEQKVMSVIGKPYRAGWRHFGYLFLICLVAGIIMSIIYIIVSMPATVTNFASMVNAEGISLGDPNGLPGYFKPLAALAILIASFVMIYVGAWFTIIGYYAYGHIEYKERERNERKTAIQKTTTQVEPDFEEVK